MEAHVVVAASARWLVPLIALVAFSMLAAGAPGDGVGLRAGLMFALAIALHALVFGVAAAKAAFPAWAWRGVMALGAVAVFTAAAAPGERLSGQIMEAGLFATVVAAASLILTVLIGRAPTLRDTE